jgi:regulator of RNase E activity RraA
VDRADAVVADDDGVLFVPLERLPELLAAAREIGRIERAQAAEVARGRSLRVQLRFDEFLKARARNPALTFREHLRRIGGAIEE